VHRIVRAYHNHGKVQTDADRRATTGWKRGETPPARCQDVIKSLKHLVVCARPPTTIPEWWGDSTPLKLARPLQRQLKKLRTTRKVANPPPTRGSLTAILPPAPRPRRGVEIRRRGGGRRAGFWKVLNPAEPAGWPGRRILQGPRSGGEAGRSSLVRRAGDPRNGRRLRAERRASRFLRARISKK
jgi:hypothetical protein